MENQPEESKEPKGTTQVGQNLRNEKIRIDHCTINIFMKDETEIDVLERAFENIKLFQQQ